MFKKPNPVLICLICSILVLLFLATFYVSAFGPPPALPPGCPAGSLGCDPPLNAGPTGQIKKGGLTLNENGALDGLVIKQGYLQLALTAGVPPSGDCDSSTERGRMKVDSAAGLLYICRDSGWVAK